MKLEITTGGDVLSEYGLLKLSYKDNFITFEFAALDYTNPLKNQYAYQLEGLHDDWIYSGNQRYATFTNLDPGEYLFRVKARTAMVFGMSVAHPCEF